MTVAVLSIHIIYKCIQTHIHITKTKGQHLSLSLCIMYPHTDKHTKWQNVSDPSDENRLWALRDTCRHQRSLLAGGLESSCWMTSGTKTHHILPALRGSSSFSMNAIISKPQLLTDTHTQMGTSLI